jgi:short subunit fatty acids transporter
MFSTNQLIFAVLFFIVFVGVMVVSYRKDKKLHKKHYKGTIWILLGFIVFIGALLVIKTLLKG